MIPLSDGPSRLALLKKTTAFFVSSAWTMKRHSNETFDLEITHRGFRCFVACIDAKVLNYISSSEIIERQRNSFHQFKIKLGATHIAVFNLPIPGVSFEKAAESGALIFHVDELNEIAKADRFFEILPATFTTREELLLQGNVDLCVSIADRYRKQGDTQNAVNWLKKTIVDKPAISIANRKLYQLYMEMGNFDLAEDIALKALVKNPKHTEYLGIMKKLSELKGDIREASEWEKRRLDASMKAPDFDSIIKRQKSQFPNSSKSKIMEVPTLLPHAANKTDKSRRLSLLNFTLKTFMDWRK
ncbi:MAG TPA: tetratricopeptide repeat protein [Acidocella sp.]|jgi:tetratricopeptide (TPR) repeat protein|nr:tetratricopeptide repeat protein [Acidocella sp.]